MTLTTGEMKHAFLDRDPTYDGIFFTGVTTTGIFCRPSCPARKPLPENLKFFHTVKEALFAGFRPCKRCEPLSEGENPEWVAKILARIDTNPSERIKDRDLRELGVDSARARRYFLKNYGMTFQAYCRGRRLGKALESIRNGGRIDDAVFDAGYESHSGFREAFSKAFESPPGKSRDQNAVQIAWIESPLGPLVAGATDQGVCLLEFTDRRMLEAQFETLKQRLGRPLVPGEHRYLGQLRKELKAYFSGKLEKFTVPLDYPGSPFQESTWGELLRIPYGQTRSYEDLAKGIGNPKAVRAVGHANGLNRIAILIPCHRVVNKSGKLGGYGGGLWRKQFLLDLERRGKPLKTQGFLL